jgi:hypothetical protein
MGCATTGLRPSRLRDRLRDQTHAAAGLTPLRFTHAQVVYEAGHVQRVLAAVVERLLGQLPEGAGEDVHRPQPQLGRQAP